MNYIAIAVKHGKLYLYHGEAKKGGLFRNALIDRVNDLESDLDFEDFVITEYNTADYQEERIWI